MRNHRGGRLVALVLLLVSIPSIAPAAINLYVSPAGDDHNPGTRARPLASLAGARDALRQLGDRKEPATVTLASGTYYLPETLVLETTDSGSATAPVVYAAAENESVVISGGVRLQLSWAPFRDGIMKSTVPAGLSSDQLFVNGQRQILARYPNFDPGATHFNGFAADAFSPARAARWADPTGGIIHAMHPSEWGDFHYVITGKDADNKVTYEGGWQNNRQAGMHPRYRFVENIFEELDAPGEWFLDGKTSTLYFYPPAGLDLARATIEFVRLPHLVEFRGTKVQPVKFVSFRGITFRHASRTFMGNREPLLRSDWTTYRGGALFFNGAEDCSIESCLLDQVGGNAVFVSNYNRSVTVRGCEITQAGGNGVAFVGDPKSVRSPLFEYNQRQSYNTIDKTPGPKTDDYPADCLVEDCLIHETGRVEKQTAPIQISMSMGITVRHCSIYDVPRAGINISEGTFGGHVIEFCDIFDTVKETGDHGSFNSWGRDRYWGLRDIDLNKVTLDDATKDLPILDIVRPNIFRNNRWRCDHGWDIDLDDGSSRYEIYNNLCLNGGIKLREGFYRVVENNIMVNNSFHPHVWYADSQDIFRHNIVFTAYKPIRVGKPWGKEIDGNLLHAPGQPEAPATVLANASGRDEHSLRADAMFVDPKSGDYRVAENSPAIRLGFKNFPMNDFGVTSAKLKAIARTPVLPMSSQDQAAPAPKPKRDERVYEFLGAKVKNIVGMGEVSASGLPSESGVIVLDVPAGSEAATAGLRKNDVIAELRGKLVDTTGDLLQPVESLHAPTTATSLKIRVFRDQQLITLKP